MKKMLYSGIRKRQDTLKRITDRRYSGIWIGPPPKLLDVDNLLAGDVLFCADTSQRKPTKLIQTTTDGVYVHCGIYIGNGKVIHAAPGGVKQILLSDFAPKYSYIAVTRSPGSNQDRSKKIVEFAERKAKWWACYNYFKATLVPLREYINIRNHYDLTKRMKIKTVSRKWITLPKWSFFCSEFVVECYMACEYIPRNHTYFRSAYWSPTGLAEENIFPLVGFMSEQGLQAVDSKDPFIAGCTWVLQ